MSKLLYLSDLDGTLLNSNAEISEYTKNELNRLIDNGMQFTFATARTAATVVHMMKGININLPVILMNGTLIYDIAKDNYIKVNSFGKDILKSIIDTMKKCGVSGFYYTIDQNKMHTFYDEIKTSAMNEFMTERQTKFNKSFERLDNLYELGKHNVVYFSFLNDENTLKPMYEKLKDNGGLTIAYYHDIYNKDLQYMELSPKSASKYNGAMFLKEYLGADKLVGFGDNLNDIPLFNACDECYAVENANIEVKKTATGVIKSNNDDGVVKYLADLCK